MFEKIVEKLVNIFKEQKTIDFAKNSIENIARILVLEDEESAVRQAVETLQYISNIKDLLFWSKVKKWLECTCTENDLELQAKISSKFTEDEPSYKDYAKRQLQFIAQVDEEEKIIYYANLTRAWLMGRIKTSLYFKMANLLKVFTLEEIYYLKENYTEDVVNELNFYVKEFLLNNLVEEVEITTEANSTYKYTDYAKVFLNECIYNDSEKKISFDKIGLSDLKVHKPVVVNEPVLF